MSSQLQQDVVFSKMAKDVATFSYCQRAKVGAMIVRDGNPIYIGYNGTPPGDENVCEFVLPNGQTKTKDSVIHAEDNALRKLDEADPDKKDRDGLTMYVTLSPCTDCADLILESGIKRVVVMNLYKGDAGAKALRKEGITVDIIGDI